MTGPRVSCRVVSCQAMPFNQTYGPLKAKLLGLTSVKDIHVELLGDKVGSSDARPQSQPHPEGGFTRAGWRKKTDNHEVADRAP
jgi:hypothetical protein